jgi:hypothetical protein
LLPAYFASKEAVMELPHWQMFVGAMLLIVGFVGSILHRNAVVTSDPESVEGDQATEAAHSAATAGNA